MNSAMANPCIGLLRERVFKISISRVPGGISARCFAIDIDYLCQVRRCKWQKRWVAKIKSVLAGFDPLVAEWFATRFGQATEPQVRGWPEIAQGRDVLISAPTGSGKTLAAFLTAINSLVRRARLGPLPDQTEIVYVSPLKALSNDVHKNLEVPLAEISALAAQRGIPFSPIRTAVRTGDTPASERQKMGKQRPHILVTTPESLYILLTAGKSREMLKTVRTVIVDEIHAVADDKRGSHLALSLVRLDALAEKKPQR